MKRFPGWPAPEAGREFWVEMGGGCWKGGGRSWLLMERKGAKVFVFTWKLLLSPTEKVQGDFPKNPFYLEERG